MNEDNYKLIELMALHEEALADYYQTVENNFQNKEVWKFLAGEEKKHAMWIRSILDNVSDGSVIFNDDMTADLYTDSILKLKQEKSAVDNNLRKLSQVFEFAINLEKDILDKQFLEVFSSPFQGIQNTLNHLKSDTAIHKEKLLKAYNQFLKQKEKILEERKKKDILEKQKHSEILMVRDNLPEEPEENDEKWIKEYKKTIAAIDDDYKDLKNFCELDPEEKEAIGELKTENIKAINEKIDVIFEDYHYIGLHAEHERLLSNLYGLFSKIFPNDELWPFMAEEERKHECWLKQIIERMKDGVIIFKKPKYPVDKVRIGIINLADIIQFCKEYKITHKEAYQIALDQENSMLEDKFLNNFSSEAPAIEIVFKKLIEDTIEHREWLKKKMKIYIY